MGDSIQNSIQDDEAVGLARLDLFDDMVLLIGRGKWPLTPHDSQRALGADLPWHDSFSGGNRLLPAFTRNRLNE
jgi:hypothetical protein